MSHAARGLAMMLVALLLVLSGMASAQEKPADPMDELREKARADKKAVVAVVLDLTESEAKASWPVYNLYQSDYLDASGGFELGTGPSVVILDAGATRGLSTTTLQQGIYAVIFGAQGLIARIGLQGSKISRMGP